MTTADQFQPRPDPGKWASIGLSALMHLALIVLLFYGVSWQSRAPDAVEVELYRAAPAPAPVIEKPTPTPRVEPKPEPKPEPKIEPKPEPKKPDIAIKEEKKPKPEMKPEPKPEPKPKPEAKPAPKEEARPKVDDTLQRKLMQDQLRRESQRLEADRLAQAAAQDLEAARGRQASADLARARNAWVEKIKQKIRGNIRVPPDARGNPEAVFDIVLLPSGEILEGSVKLRKSSGNPALDDAIERAIVRSNPLPKPDQPEVFVRDPRLIIRPLEN